MRVLILEDDPNRVSVFLRKLEGHEVDSVSTADAAIWMLQQNEYDMAFLDHDLGGKAHQQSGPGTGYEVAKWIKDHPDRAPKQIVIHSCNPAGSQNMYCVLPDARVIPFAWDLL